MKRLIAPVTALAVIGVAGLNLVKASEGLRLQPYLDPVGIPTVCYGHTGPDVRMNMRYTSAACESLLWSDIAKHQVVLLPGSAKNCIKNVPLTQNQLDAVTSFTFNIGTSKFCSSTLARKLGAKDYSGASAEFPKWVNGSVRGKQTKLPGLIKRRTAEKVLFDTRGPMASQTGSSDRLRAILGQSVQ